MMLSLEKIKLDLVNRLSKYRYEHSVRVAEEAKKLANYYGVDEDDAYLAGLIHDVAKEFSIDENRQYIFKFGLSEDLLQGSNIKICHAVIGSLVAKELYGVNDNVAQAIRYHSVGNINMNMLDKIVFVADKIEAGKNYPGIEDERVLAYKNINEALLLCLRNTKKKLDNDGKKLNAESKKLLNCLIENDY